MYVIEVTFIFFATLTIYNIIGRLGLRRGIFVPLIALAFSILCFWFGGWREWQSGHIWTALLSTFAFWIIFLAASVLTSSLRARSRRKT